MRQGRKAVAAGCGYSPRSTTGSFKSTARRNYHIWAYTPLPSRKFDFILSNSPYGTIWKATPPQRMGAGVFRIASGDSSNSRAISSRYPSRPNQFDHLLPKYPLPGYGDIVFGIADTSTSQADQVPTNSGSTSGRGQLRRHRRTPKNSYQCENIGV